MRFVRLYSMCLAKKQFLAILCLIWLMYLISALWRCIFCTINVIIVLGFRNAQSPRNLGVQGVVYLYLSGLLAFCSSYFYMYGRKFHADIAICVSDYMLRTDTFKGVKILQLVPILLSMLVFYIVVLKKKSVSIKAVITNLFGGV